MRGSVLKLDKYGRPVIAMKSYRGRTADINTTLWWLGREPDDDDPDGGGSRVLGLPAAPDLTGVVGLEEGVALLVGGMAAASLSGSTSRVPYTYAEGKHAMFHLHGITPAGALDPRTGPDWWQIVSSRSPGPQQLPSLLLDPTDPSDLERLRQLVLAGNDPQKYWPLVREGRGADLLLFTCACAAAANHLASLLPTTVAAAGHCAFPAASGRSASGWAALDTAHV